MSLHAHSPISHKGILPMVECLDLTEKDQQRGHFYIEPGIAVCTMPEILDIKSSGLFCFASFEFIQRLPPCYLQSNLVLPHALVCYAPKLEITMFLKAR